MQTFEITHHNPYLEWAARINYQRAYETFQLRKQFSDKLYMQLSTSYIKSRVRYWKNHTEIFTRTYIWPKGMGDT
jgi:hypothetical protein